MRNKILYLLIVLSFFFSSAYAQKMEMRLASEKDTQQFQKPRPVHAGEYLERFYKANGFNPDNVIPTQTTLKKAAWNFQKGTPVTWKAANFSTNAYDNVASTCQAVGNNCYIFVEDAIWGSSATQTGIDAVKNAFDNSTPANATQGIYATNTQIFGDPPNIDGDPKIIIFILDIKDTYDGQPGSGYIAGYFSSTNQLTKAETSNNSNEAEIYYLDGVQNNLTTESGLADAMSTTAHEFQHMIHFNYYNRLGKAPITFYNEMCSLSAEFMNGYPLYSQSRYTNESNQWLQTWRSDNDVLTDYSRAAKLGRYLYEQFGAALFTRFLFNGTSGITGLNKALGEIGTTRKMADILPDWFMANIINDKSVNEKWGYSYEPLALMQPKVHQNPNATYSGVIQALAVQYISFTGGKNLTFNYNNNKNTKVKTVAIKYSGGSITTEDVAPNTDYNVPEFGTSISKVTFALYNVDTSPLNLGDAARSNYSYTAAGEYESSVQELAYDETEPTGYLGLSAGDSIAVVFSGISGAKLDSIKVAVRNLVPVPGSVYEYKGLTSGFAGRKLASFTVTPTIPSPPIVIDTVGSYPYEQPYKNWVKVDLRSSAITTDNDFTVIFPVEGSYPTKNRIMTTYYQSSSSRNNFWYSSTAEAWQYYSVQGKPGYIFLNLIHAYISFGPTDAKEVIELLPTAFSLDQNYPNPFNPSTIINYQLPKSGNVQIKIFDALGREVRSLINEEKNAGKHNIMWDSHDNYGSKVSSGVYFYTITSGDFAETKKMVLLK